MGFFVGATQPLRLRLIKNIKLLKNTRSNT